jgi:hypothetical protein
MDPPKPRFPRIPGKHPNFGFSGGFPGSQETGVWSCPDSFPDTHPDGCLGSCLGSCLDSFPDWFLGTSLGSCLDSFPDWFPGTSLDTTPDRVLTQVCVGSLQSDANVLGGSNPCWCDLVCDLLLPNAPRLLDTLVTHQVCSV